MEAPRKIAFQLPSTKRKGAPPPPRMSSLDFEEESTRATVSEFSDAPRPIKRQKTAEFNANSDTKALQDEGNELAERGSICACQLVLHLLIFAFLRVIYREV